MIFKNLSKNFLISLILIILIFALDRFSKIYVIYLSNKNSVLEIFSSKFLNINLIWNDGIAFGLFSFDQNHFYNFLTIIILIVILVVFVMMVKAKDLKKYSLLMIFGGAIGNVYDRIFYRAVPDFIDFHIGEFHWFIFNVADIFITAGVIFMILFELIAKNIENNE
ncbi:signal peptidase II [Candidatus Pelagibacter sp.]|jgi:signal peptidase II|nr:signal peptidase II [Candidatus Pelagibacter sp.]|tara:strand:+ start:1079 stop:1576 length:498 start_codon:yes stop_codon:yes gene_type:complete